VAVGPHIRTALRALVRDGIAPGGGPAHVGRRLRILALAFLFLALVSMLCAAMDIVHRDTQSAFGVGLALAVLPVPLYLAVLLWADRFEPEPPALLAAVFVWGAGAALVLAYTVNTAGGTVVAGELGPQAADIFVGSVSAPVVEEALKAVPLFALALFARERIDDLVDGVVYAGVGGIGFAMSENILYYGREARYDGVHDAIQLFVLRSVWDPFIHPLFTAATGLAIAAAVSRSGPVRWSAAVGGLALAMVLHSVWNTTVGTAWYGVVYFALFVPVLIAIGIAVVRTRRSELQVLATYLPRGLGTPLAGACAQVALVATPRRHALRSAARARGGESAARAVAAYEHAATQLAFLERRIEQGRARDDADHEARRRALRRRVRAGFAELQSLGIAGASEGGA
jgi:RsiW-degrading membrane proteinase PrsW (M82 family)